MEKGSAFVFAKINFLTPFSKFSLTGLFGEQMNDSSIKGKQAKSANAKSAMALQITEPVASEPEGEVISLYAESTMHFL